MVSVLMRMRLESCAREKLFIVKSLGLHVVALTCKGITLNLPARALLSSERVCAAHAGNLLLTNISSSEQLEAGLPVLYVVLTGASSAVSWCLK